MTRPPTPVAAALVMFLAGCEHVLPTAPSELTTGIVIYEHANYIGQSAHVTSDISDLKRFSDGPCIRSDADSTYREWNDCISSVRVAPGWRATLYEHPDFKGESLDVTADLANLQLVKGTCSHGGLNDCVSAIRLHRP